MHLSNKISRGFKALLVNVFSTLTRTLTRAR